MWQYDRSFISIRDFILGAVLSVLYAAETVASFTMYSTNIKQNAVGCVGLHVFVSDSLGPVYVSAKNCNDKIGYDIWLSYQSQI